MRLLRNCRFALALGVLALTFAAGQLRADEGTLIRLDQQFHRSVASETGTSTHRQWRQLLDQVVSTPIEAPPSWRVSRSRQPLRQVRLLGGDHFVAECLEWGSPTAKFRLLNGQTIKIPFDVVATVENPPGEIDEFSAGELREGAFVEKLEPFPAPARIEFQFPIGADDSEQFSGAWQIHWRRGQEKQPPILIKIEQDRRISASGLPARLETSSQDLELSTNWHSFIALIESDRLRLIVDNAILASAPTDAAAFESLVFQPSATTAKENLRLKDFQIRRLVTTVDQNPSVSTAIDSDQLELASGDRLFGRIIGLKRESAQVEVFGARQSLPWARLIRLHWQQPDHQIFQTLVPKSGVVAQLEFQPFVDRLECEPETLKVTVLRTDANSLQVQHPWAGVMQFSWSDVRRLKTLFFGRSQVIDARQFHLGNSIRTDFHRHLPDGTELKGSFVLHEIPNGQASLSMNVAELEAAGAEAPPASPFLAELRAGRLVTELYVNQQKVGELNSLIRLKASARNPDRIRIDIPQSLLKGGQNTYHLRQQPLKAGGREYDDCELGDIRLEFEDR